MRQQMHGHARAVVVVGVAAGLLMQSSTPARAQSGFHDERPIATIKTVVVTNIAIGAAAAAIGAAFSGKEWKRPLLWGAAGGAVHVSGKLLGAQSSFPSGVAGLIVSSVGASMVGNASRGAGAMDEISLPVAFVHVRVRPRAEVKFRLAVNATEAIVHARLAVESAVRIDWARTARAGTFVFETRRRLLVSRGDTVHGSALTNVAIVSAYATDPSRTYRHELVHVQQHLLIQEVLGRPLDVMVHRLLERRIKRPRWLEAGVGDMLVWSFDELLSSGDGPIRRWRETEAQTIAR